MDKFEYVKKDVKIRVVNGRAVVYYRIRALRNIFRVVPENGKAKKYQVAKAGDLGAYIVKGALNQYDNAWAKPLMEGGQIIKECFIGPECILTSNALVEGSNLLHDVTVGGAADIIETKINPKSYACIKRGAVIRNTRIDGDTIITDNATLQDSSILGGLTMCGWSLINDCDVRALYVPLKMTDKKRFWHSSIDVVKTKMGVKIEKRDRNGKER